MMTNPRNTTKMSGRGETNPQPEEEWPLQDQIENLRARQYALSKFEQEMFHYYDQKNQGDHQNLFERVELLEDAVGPHWGQRVL